jgi:hypothetical protein
LFNPCASLLGRLKAGAPCDLPVCVGVVAGAALVAEDEAKASALRVASADESEGAVTAGVLGVVGVAVGVSAACAFVGVLLTGASTISMAMLCWLSMSVVLGDNSKVPIANRCIAATHRTTVGAVRCLSACDGA